MERGGSYALGAKTLDTSACVIGLRREKAELEDRIRHRVLSMYQHGFLDEVAELRRINPVFSPTAILAIGYAEAMAVLDGKLTRDRAMEQTVIRTRQYAKRQMTWFRNQLPTRWIDVERADDVASVAERVIHCWQHHD